MLHGGDIYKEELKGKKILDYSSNINPFGVPDSFKQNIDTALSMLEKYPDINYAELKNSIIDYLDSEISKENILLGNGASELIDLSLSFSKRVLIPVPSFVEYELNAMKWKKEITYSILTKDMKYDYEDIFFKIQNCDSLILGNPNNPSGNVIDKVQFEKILNHCEKNNKKIIIDETFLEFTGNNELSFISLSKKYSCLFIIRAITKFFGMPGVRFGYGITSNQWFAREMRRKQNPWNINIFAETAAKSVFKDTEYIRKTINWISREKIWFPDELRKNKIFDTVYNTECNFVLCKLKDIDCEKLYELCKNEGLLIRKGYTFRTLNRNFIRLAIKDRETNIEALKILDNIAYYM